METFIVRVYRHDHPTGEGMAGTVECVERQEQLTFNSRDELWHLLNLKPAPATRHFPEEERCTT